MLTNRNPKQIDLKTITTDPGVYQMYDAYNKILYIGKARNLKKRISSYFQKALTDRLAALVSQIDHIEVIVTHNENEALLLENQLIKEHKPKYNILLRDDKSYAYIVLSHHAYPRLGWRRGQPKTKDQLFGPYPSTTAVKESVKIIQKLFKLRSCRDDFFRNRSRPCLLYQIKKCTGPCVGHISEENYSEDVKNAKLLLQGKNQEVVELLISRMEAASKKQDYEMAANLRDKIAYLRHIQTKQHVTLKSGNIDVFAIKSNAVEILFIREGRMVGHKIYYPEIPLESTAAEILSAFIPQYYLDKEKPSEIIIKEKLDDQNLLEKALDVKITTAQQGQKYQWILMAEKTAEQALKFFRIVCFDISHTSGEGTVASCVVFGKNGPEKNNYRKFNIKNVKPSDDYGAMSEALERYFVKLTPEEYPDILLIDGGKGQLHCAEKIFEKLAINNVTLLAIAKGPSRKPGFEKIFMSGKSLPLDLNPESADFHWLQRVRDEAHRFAITSHRKRRAKARRSSILENIPGIGPKKRQALLNYLGGWQEIKKASVEQLSRVPGINRALAEKIFSFSRH